MNPFGTLRPTGLLSKHLQQDNVRTCASLADSEQIEKSKSLFKRNYSVVAEQALQHTLDEYLLKIDQATEKAITRLPKDVLNMRVSDFKNMYAVSGLTEEFAFEAPKKDESSSKRVKLDDRDSGESLRKRVRQQLAETTGMQSLMLPGTGPFMAMPFEQRASVIGVLSAVVATYNQVQRESRHN